MNDQLMKLQTTNVLTHAFDTNRTDRLPDDVEACEPVDPTNQKMLKHSRAGENAFDDRLRDEDFGELEKLELREKKLGPMNQGDRAETKPKDAQRGREAGERAARKIEQHRYSTIERELLE